jgi:hypothetical protein
MSTVPALTNVPLLTMLPWMVIVLPLATVKVIPLGMISVLV